MIGPLEVAVVAIGALLIFGPNRLPKLGKTIGQTLSSFKDGVLGRDDEDDDGKAKADGKSRLDDAGEERSLARRDGGGRS